MLRIRQLRAECGILTGSPRKLFWLVHTLGSTLAASSCGAALLPFIFLVGLFSVCALAFWVWMLVEVLTRETDEGNSRLIWALVIVFTHWVGALIYLLARRPERIRKLGK